MFFPPQVPFKNDSKEGKEERKGERTEGKRKKIESEGKHWIEKQKP